MTVHVLYQLNVFAHKGVFFHEREAGVGGGEWGVVHNLDC